MWRDEGEIPYSAAAAADNLDKSHDMLGRTVREKWRVVVVMPIVRHNFEQESRSEIIVPVWNSRMLICHTDMVTSLPDFHWIPASFSHQLPSNGWE